MKFRKKTGVIDAVQFTNETKDQVYHWASQKQGNVFPSWDENKQPILKIPSLNSEITCSLNDWIIVGKKGQLYIRKPDTFADMYEKIDNTSNSREDENCSTELNTD